MEESTTAAPVQTTEARPTESYDFTSALTPDVRDNPSITKFGGDVGKLAKSYLSLESLMGQGRVVVPKDENDVQAWATYDKAFDVPETADKYQLNGPDGADLSELKQFMKSNHIGNGTAQKLLDLHYSELSKMAQAHEARAKQDAETATEALRQEWGLKFDENLRKANVALHKMAGDDFEYFNQKIGNDPKFIKLLSQIGDTLSEGSLGGLEGQVGGFTKTPAEANREIDKIMNDPNDAYWAGSRNRRNDPAWCRQNNASFVSEEERKARVAYVESLLKMAG